MIFRFCKYRACFGIFCAFIASIIFSLSVHADTTSINDYVVRVSPTSQHLELNPGGTYSGTLTVSNAGDKEFDFGTFIRPYSVNGLNYDPDYDSVGAHTQIAEWVTLDSATGHLAPGESAKINYTIQAPLDVPAGGQYCAIFVGTGDSAEKTDMFRPIGSVGTVILAQVNGDTRREGTYSDQRIDNFVMFGPFTAQTSFANTGNVDYTVTSTLTARNFFTGAYDYDNSAVPSQLVVFPDKPRTIALSWPDAPPIGFYNVTYTVAFLDEEHTINQFVIFCPLWVILLFAGIIVFIVVYIILNRKKRHNVL